MEYFTAMKKNKLLKETQMDLSLMLRERSQIQKSKNLQKSK